MDLPTKKELEELINIMEDAQKSLTELANIRNEPMRGVELCRLIEVYKSPLLYAWQKYKYGWHSDFWKDDDYSSTYIQFEVGMIHNPKNIINAIIEAWKTNSPFSTDISNRVLNIYEVLKDDPKPMQ